MNERSKSVTKLLDVEWILLFAVLIDTVSPRNELHMKLQVKGNLLCSVLSHIKGFEMKLRLIN
jgi:hypothetical protein